MKTVIEYRRDAAKCLADAEALANTAQEEKRELTEDENAQIDSLMAASDAHEASAVRAEKLALRSAKYAQEPETPATPATRSPGVTPQIVQPDAPEFRHIGEMGEAVIKHRTSERPEVDMRFVEYRAATGQSIAVDSDGGFLVGTDISKDLTHRAWDEGKLEKLCWKIPISSGANRFSMTMPKENSRANGSRYGGLRVYRTAEAADFTASTTTLREWGAKVEKMTGLIYLTDELMSDASAMTEVISKGFASEFSFKKDAEIFAGTGVGQMLGILNSSGTVSVDAETGQDAATINATNIMKMRMRFGGDFSKAVWLANINCFEQLSTLKVEIGTGGELLWMPANGLQGREYDTLYARPVMFIEQAKTLGTVGDITLCDFSDYGIIEKGGLDFASSIHVNFVSGEQALRFQMRNNGLPLYDTALTPYEGTDTLSSFVTLATRA